jgi:hypothetical protein
MLVSISIVRPAINVHQAHEKTFMQVCFLIKRNQLERNRPIGITIIAILMIISGIIFIVSGIGLTALGVLSLFFLLGGIGTLLLGIASLVVAWGLLKGAGWAWIITLIITIISIIANVASLAGGNTASIVGIIIEGIIIYYLYRPNVKSYFGRANTPLA